MKSNINNCCEEYIQVHLKWEKIVNLMDTIRDKKHSKEQRHLNYSNAALLWQDVKKNKQYVSKIYDKAVNLDDLKQLLLRFDELHEANQIILEGKNEKQT